MAREIVNGVGKYYGPRRLYEAVGGQLGTAGARKEAILTFGGDDLTQAFAQLPGGAVIRSCTVEINQAFVLGGTAPVINVGVEGSAGTNRVAQITQAQAQSSPVPATFVQTPAGTLAVGSVVPNAGVKLVVALGGTSPTASPAGRAKVKVVYEVM